MASTTREDKVKGYLLRLDMEALTVAAAVCPGVIGHAVFMYQVCFMFLREGLLLDRTLHIAVNWLKQQSCQA